MSIGPWICTATPAKTDNEENDSGKKEEEAYKIKVLELLPLGLSVNVLEGSVCVAASKLWLYLQADHTWGDDRTLGKRREQGHCR